MAQVTRVFKTCCASYDKLFLDKIHVCLAHLKASEPVFNEETDLSWKNLLYFVVHVSNYGPVQMSPHQV